MATAAATFDYDTHFLNQFLLSDAKMAEEVQLQEALMASLLTCQAPCFLEKEAEDCSSVSLLCEICSKEKKDNDQVIKNGECNHSFCTDCVSKYLQGKIEEGMKIIACPALNCELNLELDSFRHLLSNDALHLWEKALSGSGRQLPNLTCSDNFCNGNPQNAFTASTSESPFPQVKTDRQYSSCMDATAAAANEEYKYSSPSMSSLKQRDKRRKSAQRYYKNVQSNRQPNSDSSVGKRHLADAKLKNVDATGNISAATVGETSSGKWKGLKDEKKDYLIVWPPMVVIKNTSLRKDENNKWIGMTTQEILNMFSSYAGIERVRHSYKWQQGHCGTTILIFESSLMGYLEAERLHKHFAGEGTHRYAWTHRPTYFLPTGERQLYGYMALKSDADDFNKYYSKGSPKLRYEMKSFREMVVNGIRQMGDCNSQLLWVKNRVAELQGHANDLEESNTLLKESVHKEVKEKEILRRRACQQHEQTLEELDSQEHFYKEQNMNITEARNEKDKDDFEKNVQSNRQPNSGSSEWKRQLADAKLKNVDAAGNISAGRAGETSSGKWKGLKDEKKDYLIVWPPMVVIANTSLRTDENNKWIGMTTQEILNMFSSYAGIVKVRNSHNWQQGHCGTSILIFESSLMGFLEAARLHKHFVGEGTHRYAWKHRPIYMALKSDVDDFNKYHSKGYPKLRYEMKSFLEMVVNAIRQMGEDNSQLLWLKNRFAELQGHANDLEESNTMLKEKVHKEIKEKPQEQREWQRDINSKRQEESDRAAEARMGFGGPQTTPTPEGRRSFYSEMSFWKEAAVILGVAIPIIWKIIRSI